MARGMRGHHAGADEIDLPGLGPQGRQPAGIESLRTNFRNDLQTGVLAGCEGPLAVIDLGEDAAEAADINGRWGKAAIAAGMVEKGQHFLGFSQGEDGHENGAASGEGLANSFQEVVFHGVPGLAGGRGLGSAGGFHEDGVPRARRGLAGDHEGLTGEIHVAGVERALAAAANLGQGRAKHMAGIMEDEFEFRTIHPKGFLQRKGFPGHHAVIDSAMGVEGVILLQSLFFWRVITLTELWSRGSVNAAVAEVIQTLAWGRARVAKGKEPAWS